MTKMSSTAFILGHPVAHSRSPLIHRHWLKTYGIEGDYIKKDVAPEELSAFISALSPQDFVGGNVTIPHKEAVFELLEHHTPQALRLKAVNTLYWEEGRLVGHNTDGYGFISHLNASAPQDFSKTKHVFILGAGGAAKPIINSLINEGVTHITVMNRTLARAEKLCAQFACDECVLTPLAWEDTPSDLANSDLIINTTSMGMNGQPSLNLDLGLISHGTIVYDIVYVPLETELLVAARKKGARCVDGLGMLLHQAVPGFEKWFGKRPSVSDELREMIVSDLEMGA